MHNQLLLAAGEAKGAYASSLIAAFAVGAIVGYLCAYRYRRKYYRARRELTLWKVENIRHEIITGGLTTGVGSSDGATSAGNYVPSAKRQSLPMHGVDKDLSELQAQLEAVQHEVHSARHQIEVLTSELTVANTRRGGENTVALEASGEETLVDWRK